MFDGVKANGYCLGWGFLLAWVFCVFYSGALDGLSSVVAAQGADAVRRLAVGVLPVGSAVASLAVIAAAERRFGAPADNRALMAAAPALTAAATPVLLFPVQIPIASQLLFAAAALVTGAGSALLWVMWGQVYACLSQDATESCAPVSGFAAAVLSLAAMVLPPMPCAVLVAAFPLASGALLWHAWPRVHAQASADQAQLPASPLPLRQACKAMDRGGFGILAACFFVSVEGSFWNASAASGVQVAGFFVISALFMLVVSVSATAGPRRVSLAFAYRWMCPLMVAGFAAIIVLGPQTGAEVAACVGIASRFAFCVITQMYFASYAARGAATSVQSYAVGWLFVHVGDLLGVLVSVPLQHAVAGGAVGLTSASAVLMVLLVSAVMLALNDGSKFLAWEVPREPGELGERDEENAAKAQKPGEPSDPGEVVASQAEEGRPLTDSIEQRVVQLAVAHKLTPRETEVFGLLAHGRSIPYVRDALFISRDTAATHAKHIYAKLDVHSRQELIDLVMSNEL